MENNFKRCMDFVLEREGGFVNHPKDPGGATNLGITMATLKAWRGHTVSVADVERLGPAEAVSIYHKKFWLAAWCDALPVGVDLLTFDAAVNMGVEPALNFVRQQVGMASSMRDAHRVFHPMEKHLAAPAKAALARRVEQGCRPAVIAGICEKRREYYRTRPHFPTFGKGWMARMAAVESLGLHLWAADPPGPA